MKLMQLTDYILMTNEKGAYIKNERLIRSYARFLKQELKLSMFLPCDSIGKPLKGKPLSPAKDSEWIRWENEQEEYFKAKEQLLFKNVAFNIVDSQKGALFYKIGDTQVFNLSDDNLHIYWHHHTIESLLSELDNSINISAEF